MGSFERLRILLIDDKREDFVAIRNLLAESDLEQPRLDWANSYESGLSALGEPGYDACLLDLALGNRSGLELLTEAGAKATRTAMILLTAAEEQGPRCSPRAAECLVKGELNAATLRRSILCAVEKNQSKLELARYREDLSALVELKTSELHSINAKLRMQIDERLAAELALRRSEKKYRSLVNSSLDVTFTVDDSGIITSLNPAFEKATGWKIEEWAGRSCDLLIHPKDRELQRECRQRIMEGEALPAGEVEILVKSGNYRVFELQSAPFQVDESIIGLIGTARDITDRKRAEEKIVEQNSFLMTVLESLSHPFYVVDAKDFKVVLANSAAIPPDLLRDVKCHSTFHGSDMPCSSLGHNCPLEEIRRTGKPLTVEHIHYDHQGRPNHVEVHGYPIMDQTGEVSQIIEYCLDVSDRKEIEEKLHRAHEELETRVRERTEELAEANLSLMVEIAERKRAEQALRLNEKRLEALLNLSHINWSSEEEIARYVLEQQLKLTQSETGAIGFLDPEEMVVNWSAVVPAQADCSSSRKEDAGTWADAVESRQSVVVNEISDTEAAGKGLPFSLDPLHRFMSIPVCDGERAVAVGVVANKGGSYDQSDLRQFTLLMDGMWKLMERERSMKALKEAENLAGIGRALSSVAHDMKTPLIAIGGFAKQIQRHIDPEDPCRMKTGIILKETERLEKMVEDMLDFSKPIELRKSLEKFDAILEESIAVTKPLADAKGVELRIESSASIPELLIDPMRIERVLINLLTNAIQASAEGGPVTISRHKQEKELLIEVSDSGPGIPGEIRKDIFLPFFTTRKGGTGLGLPIVKKVIEAHDGRIEVLDSECGATFRLRLPA